MNKTIPRGQDSYVDHPKEYFGKTLKGLLIEWCPTDTHILEKFIIIISLLLLLK